MGQITQFTRQDREDWHQCLLMFEKSGEHVVTWYKYLAIARTRKLWELDYGSWEEFCEKKLGKTVRQIQQYIADYRLLEVLKGQNAGPPALNCQFPNIPKDGVRALRRLPASERSQALAEATREAGGKSPSGPQIKAAADRRLGQREDAVPVTDARGSPVNDPQFREVFIDGAQFIEVQQYVARLKGMVRVLLESTAGGVLAEQRQDIERDRQNILSALKFSRPYAICPYCGGRRDDCQGCKGRGWVTKEAWDQSPAKPDP